MIKSEDDNTPDAILELQGKMIPDSDYWLVDFPPLRGFGNIEDQQANTELIKWLRGLAAKNKIPNKIPYFLDTSLKPKGQSSEVKNIRRMFSENGLTEEPFQNLMVVVQRVDPMQGIWDHWAPRALFVSLLVAVLSLPARLFVEEVVGMHQDLCADPTGAIKMPGGEVLCKDKTDCAQICGDPMKYIDAVTSSVFTSKAEALFVFILLPVYIFMTSVLIVRDQHMSLELRYLKGMNRTRGAIREVLAFKSQFESMRSISETCKQFSRRFAAWSPMSTGDPDLSALQSFDKELGYWKSFRNDSVQNKAFEQISKKMVALTAKHEIDGDAFWNGLYKSELNAMGPEKKWEELMKMYKLGSTDRNYSVSWTVLCRSNESWELWKAWLQGEVAQSALDRMIQSQSAQDGLPGGKGMPCYLEEDLCVGNQLIPKGFSLTHMYCFNPEDHSEFVIELRKGASASVFENEQMDTEGMDEAFARMMRVMPVYDQMNSMEQMLTQNDNSVGKDGFGIALRFAVSEQFWSTLGSDPGLSQLKGKTMTDFITNVIKEKDCPVFSDVDNNAEITQSQIILVAGEVDPMQPVLSLAKVLLKRLLVVILAFLFMLIMPCFRVYMKGGKLFPEPFKAYLIGNAVCCAIILWYFFGMFQLTSERLSLVSSSLAEFEQKTLDPSGKAAKAKDGSKDAKSEKDSKASVPEASPFDLTVNDSGHKYNPNGEGEAAEFFQQQWAEKQNNVRNWHYCIGYLRVIISSSRLTAQAILVAAGVILAFLLLMSFLDVAAGKNGAQAAQFAHNAADQARHAAGEMVEHVKEQAKNVVDQTVKDIQDTRRLSLNLGMAAGPINVASGSIEFTNATEALQELAQPVRHALSFSIGRRLAGKLDDEASKALHDVEMIRKKMLKAFDIAKTITETQFVTVALVLLVLLYSVPLIYYIAKINDSLDKHGNLLLAQKEVHRMNMANRQTPSTATAVPAGDGAADSSAAAPGGTASDKDIGCKRYEKMLDMAIESAQTNKARFPLKLFGFIINMALLGTWITLALSPLAKQVQGMTPGLTMAACQWVENLDIINQAEGLANQGVKKANEGISKANQGIQAVNNGMQKGLDKVNEITAQITGEKAKHEEMEKFEKIDHLKLFNFQKMFHSYVCKPLTKMAAEQAAKAMSGITQTRRLRSIEPLAPAVEKWWHAHPGDPHVKLLSVLSILNDLERSATELSAAIRGDSDQIAPLEAQKPILKPSLLPNGVPDDFQAWGKLHGVAHSIMSALEAEGVHNVDELAQLSAAEVDHLSRENTLGDRARFKLFVKSAQKVSSKKFNEL